MLVLAEFVSIALKYRTVLVQIQLILSVYVILLLTFDGIGIQHLSQVLVSVIRPFRLLMGIIVVIVVGL
jgi:hypothetical protein